MITTSAELKARLQVGTKIRQVWTHLAGNVDRVITVTEVLTSGFWGISSSFTYRYWAGFPEQDEIEFTDRGWFRIDSTDGFKLSEYQWVEVPV